MADSPYRSHEVLVAPARRRPQLWRLIAGLAIVVVVTILLSRTGNLLVLSAVPDLVSGDALLRGTSPAALLILLAGFGFVTVGVAIAARLIQDRSLLGIIGPMPLALVQFWRVGRLLFILMVAVLLLPPYDMGVALNRNLEPGLWFALLPLSLCAVLIQTSAEEILFRGYIQQSLAARFKSPLIWMGAPAALFAAGHYLPGEAGDNALLIALWSGVFGLVTADLTARAGTLGPAIAVHLFNNVVAILIVSMPDSLSGLALFTLPYSMSDTEALREWLIVDFAMLLVSWLAARVVIRR